MERNSPSDHNRSPPSPPTAAEIQFFTAETQNLHPFYHQLPPLQPQEFLPFYQPSHAAPFLPPPPLHGGATVDSAPFFPQFFAGGEIGEGSSRDGRNGASPPRTESFFPQPLAGFEPYAGGGIGPPPRRTEEEEVTGFVPAAGGLTVQQESGHSFGKPLTEENEGTIGAQSEQQVDSFSFEAVMDELEAMCKNDASVTLPPSATNAVGDTPHEKNVDGGSNSKEKGIKEEVVAAITECIEVAVKRLMVHQQTLHEECMEKLKKMDRERRVRDEELRQTTAKMIEQMATFRENDKVIAEERWATIISYLEKITGQTIQMSPQVSSPDTSVSDRKWANGELDKLIEIRVNLEPRFRKSGYKFSSWEEVSGLMVAAGYQQTATRCKKKWDGIKKYYKSLKINASPNKHTKKAKTCQYYEKLDRFYSKSSSGCSTMDVNGNGGTNPAIVNMENEKNDEEEEGEK